MKCYPCLEKNNLPDKIAIQVAEDSDRLDQPFMFTFPGTESPQNWPDTKKGTLQSPSGFTSMFIEEIQLPEGVLASSSLKLLKESGCIENLSSGPQYSVLMRLENVDPKLHYRFRLPDFLPVKS